MRCRSAVPARRGTFVLSVPGSWRCCGLSAGCRDQDQGPGRRSGTRRVVVVLGVDGGVCRGRNSAFIAAEIVGESVELTAGWPGMPSVVAAVAFRLVTAGRDVTRRVALNERLPALAATNGAHGPGKAQERRSFAGSSGPAGKLNVDSPNRSIQRSERMRPLEVMKPLGQEEDRRYGREIG